MTSSLCIPLAAGERPLGIHKRPDLEYRAVGQGSARFWRIKDPVAARHFELSEEEYFVFRQLDGSASAEGLVRACEERFAPRRLAIGNLMAFLARLHREGLVVSQAAGQGEQLLIRSREQTAAERRWAWTRLLGLRWRGVDPTPLLAWLEPRCRWTFRPWFALSALSALIGALLLLATHSDAVRLRLPEIQAFVSPHNIGWLIASVVLVKLLHELGHAVACRHFGGECHELGILLLVCLPCFYCNVSDAWMFADRWRRVVVDAAGMIVELMLATGCVFLWWYSVPGTFNTVCFNLMIVCSVNTLLLNGNPLLRYDGYYLLSDLLEVPNLHQRASDALARAWASCFLIDAGPRSGIGSSRGTAWLAAYAVASTAYRVFVSAAIVWFCYRALQPYRLESLAWWFAGLMIAVLLVGPLRRLAQFVSHPLATRRVRWPRLPVAAALLTGAMLVLWHVPVPHRVRAPAVVQPADARRIYVTVPGVLADHVMPAERVTADQPLATLANRPLEYEIAKLRGERDQQRLKVQNLKRRQFGSAEAATEIPTAEEALADLEGRLNERLLEQNRLTIRAPASGIVLPTLRPTQTPTQNELPRWQGDPLAAENRGCFLETGTLLCQIGDPGHLEAMLLVDEEQVEFVRLGQQVRLSLAQSPETIFNGTVAELARIETADPPTQLLVAGRVAARRDRAGHTSSIATLYQARVALDASAGLLVAGAAGEAKILVDPRPLGQTLARLVWGTFRFAL